jgi:membrane-bound lytic murein transglycosylase B
MRVPRCLKPAVCGALAVITLLSQTPRAASQAGYAARPEVREFIAELAANDGFNTDALHRLFASARFQPAIVAAMSRPLIAPPQWHEYAPRFVNPARIEAGVAFWRENSVVLTRAERAFGVPQEVIVAIIGVETNYGRNTGSYRVLDALTTLAFDYPRRAEFFRGELRQFLLLAREQGISPLLPNGSYAGAIGIPQFMPGSIRAYAVDFDGDGTIDLEHDVADAVGSVGNFLLRNGWQPGQPVMTAARVETEEGNAVALGLDGGMGERRPLAEWIRLGVTGFEIPGDLAPEPVGLIMLEEPDAPSYWLAFNNWYVLTRYNRSRLYASAVHALALAVKEAAVH